MYMRVKFTIYDDFWVVMFINLCYTESTFDSIHRNNSVHRFISDIYKYPTNASKAVESWYIIGWCRWFVLLRLAAAFRPRFNTCSSFVVNGNDALSCRNWCNNFDWCSATQYWNSLLNLKKDKDALESLITCEWVDKKNRLNRTPD